jgi:hypothetical protein
MTSSPVNCHEIHAATRLPYQRVTLRFRRDHRISKTEKWEIAGGKSTNRDIM